MPYEFNEGKQAGIPYDNINWSDIPGQPLGVAVFFSGFILGDLVNIADSEGPLAVSGSFTGSRGVTIGGGKHKDIPLSPTYARCIVGGETDLLGVLNVSGHTVSGSEDFTVQTGSSYTIGKSDQENQFEELKMLYSREDGSQYWEPDKIENGFIVPCYDIPRYISAQKIDADIKTFFDDAAFSLSETATQLSTLDTNGESDFIDGDYILTGSNKTENIFIVDFSFTQEFTGNIHIVVPDGSISVVLLKTQDTLHITSHIWGNKGLESKTIFVVSDTTDLVADYPVVFCGSFLAPEASFFANTSGGSINGNAVFKGLWTADSSSFRLNWFPFEGGVDNFTSSFKCPYHNESKETRILSKHCENRDGQPCSIVPGVISGVAEYNCCWALRLIDFKTNEEVSHIYGYASEPFYFSADEKGSYLIRVESCCGGLITFYNVGVDSLTIDC